MNIQLTIIIVTFLVIIGLGFAMKNEISKHDQKQKGKKKKKGRSKYLPESKKMGK